MMKMVGGVPATGKQFSVNPGVDKNGFQIRER